MVEAPAPAAPLLDDVPARILVVEDDATVAEVVAQYLRRDGYEVEVVSDGLAALTANARLRPELIVLDVMLPNLDGLEVLRQLRRSSDTAVILLTGRDGNGDRVTGLRTGADDYVVKPFNPSELVARVAAVLRRARPAPVSTGSIVAGPVMVDQRRREVTIDGRPVALTALEFDLLAFLVAQPGRVFKRAELLESVWGFTYGDTATVTVHVGRLRAKIEDDPAHPRLIRTVWGVGYSFIVPE